MSGASGRADFEKIGGIGERRQPHTETPQSNRIAGSLVQLDPILVASAAAREAQLARKRSRFETGMRSGGIERGRQSLRPFRLAADAERTPGRS